MQARSQDRACSRSLKPFKCQFTRVFCRQVLELVQRNNLPKGCANVSVQCGIPSWTVFPSRFVKVKLRYETLMLVNRPLLSISYMMTP